jgi:hypothetical protein
MVLNENKEDSISYKCVSDGVVGAVTKMGWGLGGFRENPG